jgi:hypothetical protein
LTSRRQQQQQERRQQQVHRLQGLQFSMRLLLSMLPATAQQQ